MLAEMKPAKVFITFSAASRRILIRRCWSAGSIMKTLITVRILGVLAMAGINLSVRKQYRTTLFAIYVPSFQDEKQALPRRRSLFIRVSYSWALTTLAL